MGGFKAPRSSHFECCKVVCERERGFVRVEGKTEETEETEEASF